MNDNVARPPKEENICTDREALIDHLIIHILPRLRTEIADLSRKVVVAHERIDTLTLAITKIKE